MLRIGSSSVSSWLKRVPAVESVRASVPQWRRARGMAQGLERRILLSGLGSNWMAGVSDSIPLTQMSIPGTHDTMTGSADFTVGDLLKLIDDPVDKFISDAIPDVLQDGYSVVTFGQGDLRHELSSVANAIINTALLPLAFGALPAVQGIAKTQDLTLQQQLDEGVRALDIRLQQTNDTLTDVHASLPIGDLQFVPDVMQVATNFLAQNPSETIIMQVQEDSTGPGNSSSFDQVFQQAIQPFGSYVWQPTAQEPVPATLGEARGKIVVIQSKWDTPDPNYPTPALLNLTPGGSLAAGAPANSSQDHFETADLDQKFNEAKATLDYAAANLAGQNAPATFTANYLSANHPSGLISTSASYPLPIEMATGDTVWFNVNLPTSLDGAIADLTGQWITLDAATGPGMNAKVDDYLNSEPRNAPTGIVFTDFADLHPNLIQDIYSHNPRIKLDPVNIVYGTTLANNQLTGSVSAIVGGQSVPVSGTFSYTSAAGTLLNAGNGQSESVTFTPDDLTDFTPETTSVIVNVAQATPTLSISASPVVVLGTGTKLTASTVLAGGFGETGQITFTLIGPGGNSLETESANVSGNGIYSTPNGYLPTLVGKYQWVANYTGDGNNKAAGTLLDDAPQVAVGRGATVVDHELYLVGNDADDQLNIQHNGASNTGGTGIRVSGKLNGVQLGSLVFNPAPAGIYIVLFNGNDSANMENSLTLPTVVSDGNGDDNISLAQGDNSVTVGSGNVQVQAGNGNNTVTANTGAGQARINLGDGNNAVVVTDNSAGQANVQVGDGNNTITTGQGRDNVHVGDGNNVVVVLSAAASTGDQVLAGNGNNLIVGGLGQENLQAGNGSNILIDGSVQLANPGDSLTQVLNDWITNGAAAANVAGIRSRLTVTYNTTNKNRLHAGKGLDWFWFTDALDQVNRKPTDLLN
jgi:Ca2+-binding RTX toxin-like protein